MWGKDTGRARATACGQGEDRPQPLGAVREALERLGGLGAASVDQRPGGGAGEDAPAVRGNDPREGGPHLGHPGDPVEVVRPWTRAFCRGQEDPLRIVGVGDLGEASQQSPQGLPGVDGEKVPRHN